MESMEETIKTGKAVNSSMLNVLANEHRMDFDVNYVLDTVRRAENLPELRVAAYIRVSTDLLDQENSYIMQEQYFNRVITSNPAWKLVGIYSDYGLSGTGTADRIGFCRLIRHCKEGKIDRVLCKSISRFARNTADFSSVMRMLRSWHVSIFFEKENLDSADMQNEFVLSVLGAFAQEESRSISGNIRDGFRMRMSQGNVPNVEMYGYRYTGNWLRTEKGYEYREIEPFKEEADIVQIIYEKVADGRSFAEVARYLNAQGIPAPNSSYNRVRKANSKKGQLNSELDDGWKVFQIANIVRNERYVGDVLTQKTFTPDYLTHKVKINKGELHQYYIKDHHTAIVERELYEKVQTVLEKKRKKKSENLKREESPFAKRIICKECGRFYGISIKDGTNTWYCPTSAQKNGLRVCHAENVNEEEIIYILCKAILEQYGLNRAMIFGKWRTGGKEQRNIENDTRKRINALFRDMKHRLEKILNDDYVEHERSLYKGELAELDAALEDDAVKMVRLENEELAELRKKHRAREKKYKEIAQKLSKLEEYWKELEHDYELRAEALQWFKTLPRSRNGLKDFLQGMTGRYFRAFVLDMTVCPQEKYIVHWFDDICTEVERKKCAEGDDANV